MMLRSACKHGQAKLHLCSGCSSLGQFRLARRQIFSHNKANFGQFHKKSDMPSWVVLYSNYQ